MWKAIIRIVAICFVLLAKKAEGKCALQISPQNSALLTQNIGNKVIVIPSSDNTVELDENDKLQAFCSTGFFPLETNCDKRTEAVDYNYKDVQSLSFQCKSNAIFVRLYNYKEERYVDMNVTNHCIICSSGAFSIYDSRDALPNCDENMSYGLGAKTETPIIVAGLCYDLDRLKLRYVTYKLHEPSRSLDKAKFRYPLGLNVNSLLKSINIADSFFKLPTTSDLVTTFDTMTSTNFWLNVANYEIDSIVQTTTHYTSSFHEFSTYFNVVWWHNLRVGNWRRFIKVLEKRAERVPYNIYTGSSGIARVPVEEKSESESNLIIATRDGKTAVPQYIWSYVQSMYTVKGSSNRSIEDFVVIGYNSPFFEYFNKNSTLLCQDICDTIDWLKPMRDSRSVTTLGIFFCCKASAVVGHLDGFPIKTTNESSNRLLESTWSSPTY